MKKITQSFILDMREYLKGGSCGNLIREKWINDRLLDDGGKAAQLGCYFEYIFTLMMTGKGSLPKNGQIPRADYYAKSLKALPEGKQPWDLNELKKPILDEDDMLAPYKLAHVNARRLKRYFDVLGIKVVKAGQRLTKGRFEGTIDLICEATKKIKWTNGSVWEKGYRFVFDMKYSGLVDDDYKAFGWGNLAGNPKQLESRFTQAIQYHFITGLDFYFAVVSSTNDIDVKFMKIEITEQMVGRHINEGNDLKSKLDFYESVGWEARPDIAKCDDCALKNECKDVAEYPQVEIIE